MNLDHSLYVQHSLQKQTADQLLDFSVRMFKNDLPYVSYCEMQNSQLFRGSTNETENNENNSNRGLLTKTGPPTKARENPNRRRTDETEKPPGHPQEKSPK